ncbi:MAG: BspA family leucine-rich repeat surface protein [Candidatus Heimdallarchaeota archaeon]
MTYIGPTHITFNEGINRLDVWANDSIGNIAFATVFFSTMVAPIISILNPLNNIYNNATQLVEINATDPSGINTIWYNWEGANVTYTGPTYITFNEGLNWLQAWANDSMGNTGSTLVSFTIDLTAPGVSILNPTNATYNNATHLVEINATDPSGINTIWYNWEGVNVTYTGPTYITFNEGLNMLQAWAKDSSGNIGSISVLFTIDLVNPIVTIQNPIVTIYNNATQLVEITATDLSGIDTIWYNWEGLNITYTNPTYIKFNEGSNTLYAWANDTVGNIGMYSIKFLISFSIFNTTWDTIKTSTGSTNEFQISLPLVTDGMYNFIVSWGDRTIDTITSWNQPEVTHTYAIQGVYNVRISGLVSGWRFNNGGDHLKLIKILSWGDLHLGNYDSFFYGCSNLMITTDDLLNLTGATSFDNMFRDCQALEQVGRINEWNISKITTMHSMFYNTNFFNDSIGGWDVSRVKDMRYMFYQANSFNQPINNWNVSSVTDMSYMFYAASSFNQPIGNWDVLSVTDMSYMFLRASTFNQDNGGWNVSRVTTLKGMFLDADSFNQDIGNWDVSRVTRMDSMFSRATNFNQDIGNWNVSRVIGMSYMFDEITLSTTNYDSLLIGWSQLNLQTNVNFNAGNSQYSAGAAADARESIINNYSWSIADGGQV